MSSNLKTTSESVADIDLRDLNDSLSESMDNNQDTNGDNDNSDYESCDETADNQAESGADGNENIVDSDDDEYAQHVESEWSDETRSERKREAIDLKNEGNKRFKEQMFVESGQLYSQALRVCPKVFADERSVMYANRAAAHTHLNLTDKAIADCGKAIALNSTYLKPLLRRAQLYRQSKEKLDDALNDYKRVLELDSGCAEARAACVQLPLEINERNEHMKTEMLGKLKELGNLVLRPFGLSTDNFKLTQNPESGGYSVNFQNN